MMLTMKIEDQLLKNVSPVNMIDLFGHCTELGKIGMVAFTIENVKE